MVYDLSRRAIVLFGGEAEGRVLDDLWAWGGQEWSPVPLSGPSARRFPSLVYARNRDVLLLFGGDQNFTGLADTWELEYEMPGPGDLNCDCAMNTLDIEPFILALFDPAAYENAYPECSIGRGDVTRDGFVNALDIEPFILALLDPDEYEARWPHCDLMRADLNGDGSVNALDIEPFLDLLFP